MPSKKRVHDPKKRTSAADIAAKEEAIVPTVIGNKVCASVFHEGPRELPATLDYFYARQSAYDGLSSICKLCHRKQQFNTSTLMKQQALKVGSAAMVKLARANKSVPHLTELVEEAVSAFGGLPNMVNAFVDNVNAATPGSPHKLRAYEAMFHMICKTTELGHADKPMHLMTDAELQKVIEDEAPKIIRAIVSEEQEEEYDGDGEPEVPGSEVAETG